MIHEQVNVSYEKDSFNKHLRNYTGFTVPMLIQVLRINASSALKTDKKTLNATSSKIRICMA